MSKRTVGRPVLPGPAKRPRLSADVLSRIHESEGKNGKNGQNLDTRDPEIDTLNKIEVHPLLRESTPTPTIPKNFNPLKSTKVREGFVVNPYVEQQNFSSTSQRQRRPLNFNEKGKYIERANELREKLEHERQEKERQEKLAQQGLTPNEVLGEQLYEPVEPPSIEWWDQPLLKGRSYKNLENNTYSDITDEENPISVYVQHPVPINAPWEKHLPPPKPLFLTKKELKRLRKNERMVKLKEKQDRIKLGLDPTPAPKVKLKNLMNVLTNDAIKNPTKVEMQVKREIEERRQRHEEDNLARMASKDERHLKLDRKFEEDLKKGYFSAVFRVKRLVNPQHAYKVDMNAKQLNLFGMCINLRGGASLVLVEGGSRSVNKYKRLMLERINWKENAIPKRVKEEEMQELEDLSRNSSELLWEGQLLELHFSKWTVYDFDSEEDIVSLLSRYRLDNYWTQLVNEG